MNEKISVIVPIYNTKEYLPECLQSLINQTYKNLEIILVDDGSTDGSGAVCDSYAEKDKRIVVIHKANGGVGSGRNAGIDTASGDWLSFVDSDDYVHPEMYEILVKLKDEYNADIASGFTRGTDKRDYCEPDRDHYEIKVLSGKDLYYKYLTHKSFEYIGYCPTGVGWKIYKKELFGSDIRFDETVHKAEDMIIFPYLLDRAHCIVTTDRRLYYVYNRPGSLTRCRQSESIQRNYAETINRMYKEHLEFFLKKGCDYSQIVDNLYRVALFDLMTSYDGFNVAYCKEITKRFFRELFKQAKKRGCLTKKHVLIMTAFLIAPASIKGIEKLSKH